MLSFEEAVQKLTSHVKTALKVEDFNITLAKQEKDQTNSREVWRFNFDFKEKEKNYQAMVELDADGGEVLLFKRDSQWRI
ncbi:MAG: hypothetical protein M1515_04150 [Candidatus Thermoplasmatota archaeon]|jgi:hypothetical protein|nr:hypothetical protein [Candidatus Thermoplasmatota archaeon]